MSKIKGDWVVSGQWPHVFISMSKGDRILIIDECNPFNQEQHENALRLAHTIVEDHNHIPVLLKEKSILLTKIRKLENWKERKERKERNVHLPL